MSQWFRFYNEALDDPKVQKLPAETFRGWVNLLCLAARNDGVLPPHADIAFALRLTDARATALLDGLIEAELLDHDDSGIRPHNWSSRQYKSDVSNERVKRHREQAKTVTCNVTPSVTETPPDTESEQKQSRADTKRSAEGFAEFWNVYPKKVSKGRALKAYNRVVGKEATAEQLLVGAKRYAAECRGKDLQYVAHGASWINDSRWLDETPQSAAAAGITPEEAAAKHRALCERYLKKLAAGESWPSFMGSPPGDESTTVPADLLARYEHAWKKPRVTEIDLTDAKSLCPPI